MEKRSRKQCEAIISTAEAELEAVEGECAIIIGVIRPTGIALFGSATNSELMGVVSSLISSPEQRKILCDCTMCNKSIETMNQMRVILEQDWGQEITVPRKEMH